MRAYERTLMTNNIMRHNLIFKLAMVFIGFATIVVIGMWCLWAYIGYSVVSDPEGSADKIGSFVGSVIDGAKNDGENHSK